MPHLTQHLSLLETRGLVRTTLEHATPIVRFKHALTREATYNSMLQVRRAELHRAAAQTLTALYPQPDLEMVLTIADHWQRGSEDGAALQTVLPHAQRLIYTGRSTSLTTLLEHLQRENLHATQQRDLDIALADAYQGYGEYQRSLPLYESALPFADSPTLKMRVLHGIGVNEYYLGNFARAIEIQQMHLALATQENDLTQRARASSGIGAAYIGLGDFERATEYFQASCRISIQAGRTQELANAQANLAVALYNRGLFHEAIDAAEHASKLDEQNGVQVYDTRNASLLGASYFGLEDYERAEQYYRRALETSRALGDHFSAAVGLTNLAELFGKRSDLDLAAESYAQAVVLLRALKNDAILGYVLSQSADIQRRRAAVAMELETFETLIRDATQQAQQAEEIAQRFGMQEQNDLVVEILAAIHETTFAGPVTKGV